MRHPFVRVHIVNAETGMYLEKTMPNPPFERAFERGGGGGFAPATWNKESVATITLDPQN